MLGRGAIATHAVAQIPDSGIQLGFALNEAAGTRLVLTRSWCRFHTLALH